jgi:hypothetical protein
MFKVLHSIPSTAKIKDFGGLVHVVEHLLCKYKALISKLQSHQKKKKEFGLMYINFAISHLTKLTCAFKKLWNEAVARCQKSRNFLYWIL